MKEKELNLTEKERAVLSFMYMVHQVFYESLENVRSLLSSYVHGTILIVSNLEREKREEVLKEIHDLLDEEIQKHTSKKVKNTKKKPVKDK